MVITTTSKEYIAVQCKFHQDSVSYNDLSTFLSKLQSGVGEVGFKKGIIISTSNLSSNALNEIEQIRKSKGIDIVEISEEDFIYSQIDWEKFDPTQTQGELPLCDKKKPRPHQIEAIKATKEYFSDPKNTRGKLIMACGTGKTYTSLKIMEALEPKITLFLAPSIALLSQTFREYTQEKSDPFYASIVCSDDKVGKGKKNKNDDDTDDINFSELPLKPSTSPKDILSVCEKAQKENKRFIIFSTYQSALRIQEAQRMGLGAIDLIICDEAHRTVGAMYSSNERDDKNAFTLCHSDEHIQAKKRLYMTATPKVYSESSKAKAKESDNAIYSMDDESIFGEEIYTLNFARAIALDLLTDYKVIILAVRKENLSGVTNSVNKKISRLEAQGTKLDKKLINNEFVCKIIGTHKGLAKQDLIALDDENKEDHNLQNKNDTTPSQRAISFCKSISTSKNIKESFETIMECYNEELKKKSFKNLTISIDHIDGTMNCKVRLEKLEELNEFKPNTCKVLSNARCLSEGVDVPAERQFQLPKIFPDKDAQNVVINTGMGNGKNFSALVSDCISDRAQAYPLYYYDDLGNRHYAISGYALNLFRKHYEDNSIAEEEIFYYIYAIFHHKGYLEKYKNSLTKEDPRIALSEDFKELSILGKELAELHLNYESGEMHASVDKTLMNAEEKGYYDVETMTKKGDRIHYNNHIAITKIPKKAFDYVVNGKSAIDWVIERYKKTTDEDSKIKNNPNDYADGKYVFELLCRVIKLSIKSVDLIEKISEKRFE
ncbi:hypothetical protein HPOK310_0662 [Helicobacter pylori OK310]|uniref:type ISP restriction/modification enzyme n=1 Tax=Helicobacter pylori TaxID=210 RepID=UPI0002C07620|nr:hypothetical protein HPOK310_0662 [Helicobacter pylori OK310]